MTNDDGIYAEGLWTLARRMARLGSVIVVAPDREQSGIGTGITLGRPVRATRITSPVEGIIGYAVEGTPGDATILAVHALLDEPVDAVVSGINLGSNVGNDTLISGTVGAAMHGYFNGIFSLAVSLDTMTEPHFELAARLAALVVAGRRDGEVAPDLFLNLNVPNEPLENLAGLAVVPLGGHSWLDTIEEQRDAKGRRLFQIRRGRPAPEAETGTDVWALRNHHAVLTPLRPGQEGDEPWGELEELAGRLWQRLLTTPPDA